MIHLSELGFQPFFANQFDRFDRPDLVPARIAADGPGIYHLLGCRTTLGEVSGRLRQRARLAVGDWVAVDDRHDRAVIHHLLDRRTLMQRRAADSDTDVQVIAANLDVVFVVTSANRDFNPRRIERYLTAVWESGARPVVILNKIDLVSESAPLIAALEGVALGVPVLPVSAALGTGLESLRQAIGPGLTVGFVGSSGVGKSSLVNRLLGEELQVVNAIREDDARGRHTTTRRELRLLPGGGLLLDTPGMRELGLTDDGSGLAATFADIEAAAEGCRFRDCRHEGEPGCAVEEALVSGEIDHDRWTNYRKLQREIAAAEARRDPVLAAEQRRRWKVINKSLRDHPKLSHQR
ncbi:MAG: ribosome small subunit-dependent GTPase A [Thermomicrobiales bacterium]